MWTKFYYLKPSVIAYTLGLLDIDKIYDITYNIFKGNICYIIYKGGINFAKF